MAALERGEPKTPPPFGFNRIITPHNMESPMIDLLNVKYVFSLDNLNSEKFDLVFEEGQTKVYKNKKFLERTFFVEKTVFVKEEKESISKMFDEDLSRVAIINEKTKTIKLSVGKVFLEKYDENKIIIRTTNSGDGFMVLSDAYYQTWEAFIDGKKTKIYKTNHALRGVFVPTGEHLVVFKNNLFDI